MTHHVALLNLNLNVQVVIPKLKFKFCSAGNKWLHLMQKLTETKLLYRSQWKSKSSLLCTVPIKVGNDDDNDNMTPPSCRQPLLCHE